MGIEKYCQVSVLCALGALIRFILMFYGRWQDATMEVKYTDIDYHVFTDASRFITQGQSPYMRDTYRYTPILAWILTPNITCFMEFGKVIFILCDVATGYMLYAILKRRSCSDVVASLCSALWLLNPLPMTVSSRGNAESILAVLVLATIHFIMNRTTLSLAIAGLFYGTSVHMKIYPVTYSLPIYLMLNNHFTGKQTKWKVFGFDILPNKERMVFIFFSALSFLGLTYICYVWCGWDFIEETYLYHVTRRDIKHNFSIYFYMLYLMAESQYSWVVGLCAFIPQVTLLLLSSWSFHDDLPFCCFINTFIFVTFNKVCTSQYFLWYLCLLPLTIPSLDLTMLEAVIMLSAWFAGQALWLTPAYYLEFQGKNTFFLIWLASIVFFLINCTILYRIVTKYKKTTLFSGGKLVSLKSNVANDNFLRRPLHQKKTK